MLRSIFCDICKKKTEKYYLDIQGRICIDCLIKIYDEFPKGKGVYLPCKLCDKWYCEESYGEIILNCGNHDDESLDLDIFVEY